MNSLFRFLEKYQFLIIFLLLEGFSLWLLAGNNYYQKAKFGNLSRGIISTIDNQKNRMNQYLNLKQDNIELITENVELRNEISRLKHKIESSALTFSDSVSGIRYSFSSARVVNNSINKQNNFLTLNVGSNHGILPEMGVISKNGVVGIVASVSRNYSTVISLLNTSLKVSAKHKRTGFFGSLYWDGLDYRNVVLSEIPQHVDLAIGDTITTSGYSSIFPENVPLGTIKEYNLKGGNFYIVKVKLLSDFKQLDNVYIIQSHSAIEKKQLESLTGNE
ncbi:MAG: rod shape-determining protein MreC [Tenuifilaceae bacterium]